MVGPVVAQTVSDEMINNGEVKKEDWNAYESSVGLLSIGDTLIIGSAASDGSDQYVTLVQYKYSGYKAMLYNGFTHNELLLNSAGFQGTKVIVESIITRGTKKRMGLVMDLILAENKAGISGNFSCINPSKAFQLGELINSDHITREMAISKLKEAKELLDLGLYSQSDYDALKEELTPIIVNDK